MKSWIYIVLCTILLKESTYILMSILVFENDYSFISVLRQTSKFGFSTADQNLTLYLGLA